MSERARVGVSGGMAHQGKEFVIQHALAPSYLPLRVLEKVRQQIASLHHTCVSNAPHQILFVGEAVTIFQIRSGAGKERGVASSGWRRDSGLSTILTGAGSKFRSEQFRFTDMLTRLQQQEVFQLHEFEKVVDSIRDCVAEVQSCDVGSGHVMSVHTHCRSAAVEPAGGGL